MDWRVLALRLLDHFADDWLKLEPLHLCVGELFAACSILFNPQQPQMAQPQFGQHPPGLEIAPQPSTGAMPIYQVPPNGQPPAGAAPIGVAIPGMIVPAPQQPGTIAAPQPPRRPGGQDEDR